ncbi:hypothetical protein KSP40_PGU019464 [Platanthera guangdongensis]|uniref:Uncharacterized protein n=1 Tax=Platanthera guangdongensis TaxID=2320717 RepID=A0ABR2MWM1_9ASPA
MAIVMKQQNRTEEAIEDNKSRRSRCSEQSQESLDNIHLDIYKICLMKQGKMTEANTTLKQVRPAMPGDGARLFDALLGTSLIWHPQPCMDHHLSHESFVDENAQNSSRKNALNVGVPPFYSMSRTMSDSRVYIADGLVKLKRTRSKILTEKVEVGEEVGGDCG